MYTDTFITEKLISNIKIALLGDIHYYYPNYDLNILKKIEEQIKKCNPNYTCIVGDLIDEQNLTDYTELLNFLNNIAKTAPIIYVMGNHEIKINKRHKWYYEQPNTFINELKKIENLFILEDSTYTDKKNNITFYGFNPSFIYYEKKHEAYESFTDEVKNLKTILNPNTYNILLIHSPMNIYYFLEKNPSHELNKVDLILSGHMHNSCLPFFFTRILNKVFRTTRGLISPTRKLFPKYSQGKVTKIKNGFIHQGIHKLSDKTNLKYFNIFYREHIQSINIKRVSK